MSVQQSRWFQHLPKKLYEYSGTELFHCCSAVQAKTVSDCPGNEGVRKRKRKEHCLQKLGDKSVGFACQQESGKTDGSNSFSKTLLISTPVT